MHYLLIVFLLLENVSGFAQSESSANAYITVNPRQNIYDPKWYLSSAQISDLSWNDSSSMITSMPIDGSYIRFEKKLELGKDRFPEDLGNITFVHYKLQFADYEDHDDSNFEGSVSTYRTKRNAKRSKHPTGYYDFIVSNTQLILLESIQENYPFENIYYLKTLVFSNAIDSLEFTTNILGNWKPGQLQNLLFMNADDTLTLTKVPAISTLNPEPNYNFAILGGYTVCSSDCFALPDPDYAWNDNYLSTQYNYALDIEKRQLIIFSEPYSNERNKIFDIIELNKSQLKLTLHQENKNIQGPAK